MRARSERSGGWASSAAAASLALLAAVAGLAGAAQALLDKVIAAHGGMQAWQSLEDLTFTLTFIGFGPRPLAPE